MGRNPVKLTPISHHGAALVERDGWQIADRFSTVEAEVEAVKRSVGLSDLSAWGKVLIQGRDAVSAIASGLGAAPERPGQVIGLGNNLVARLTREDWYVVTPVGGEGDALARLNQAIGATGVFASATDLTHAKGALLIAGPQSRQVLSKLCGLDFHPSAFPTLTAAQSSLAKVAALIIRHDLSSSVPAYQVHVNRSETEYVWGAVTDAAGEFGGQPVGLAAVTALAA